jgi:hypothetical protein
LEDAVTTQDTVTMLRGAIRGLLRACPPALKTKVRAGLQRDDDYAAPGKPACDWTDREQLVDALVGDAYRAHFALRDQRLDERTAEAAMLLATVTGQDIQETDDGRFRIFEGTAPDRVISTVDPEAATGTRPPPTALTATKPTSRSTRLRGHLCRRGQRGHQRRRLGGTDTAW